MYIYIYTLTSTLHMGAYPPMGWLQNFQSIGSLQRSTIARRTNFQKSLVQMRPVSLGTLHSVAIHIYIYIYVYRCIYTYIHICIYIYP